MGNIERIQNEEGDYMKADHLLKRLNEIKKVRAIMINDDDV